MKTNQTAVQATATNQLVPEVLFECMAQIKSVSIKIEAYCDANVLIQDCCETSYATIDNKLHSIAYEISEMMRTEMLNSTFYTQKNQESEVCNA